MTRQVVFLQEECHLCRLSPELGREGYQSSHDLINTIMGFKMPPQFTLTDVLTWFGLVNQIAPFLAITPNTGISKRLSSARDTTGRLVAKKLSLYDVLHPKAILTNY